MIIVFSQPSDPGYHHVGSHLADYIIRRRHEEIIAAATSPEAIAAARRRYSDLQRRFLH